MLVRPLCWLTVKSIPHRAVKDTAPAPAPAAALAFSPPGVHVACGTPLSSALFPRLRPRTWRRVMANRPHVRRPPNLPPACSYRILSWGGPEREKKKKLRSSRRRQRPSWTSGGWRGWRASAAGSREPSPCPHRSGGGRGRTALRCARYVCLAAAPSACVCAWRGVPWCASERGGFISLFLRCCCSPRRRLGLERVPRLCGCLVPCGCCWARPAALFRQISSMRPSVAVALVRRWSHAAPSSCTRTSSNSTLDRSVSCFACPCTSVVVAKAFTIRPFL